MAAPLREDAVAYHRWRQKALDVELRSAEARSKIEDMKTFIASCRNQSDFRATTGCDDLDVPRQVGRMPESLDAFEQETTGLAEAGDTPADLVYWKIDIENFIRSRRAAAVITTAVIIILQPNLGLPRWHGSLDSSLMFFIEGRSQLPTSGDLMAAFMGATIMDLAGVMLWKRWRGNEVLKTNIVLFALLVVYPILSAGAPKRIFTTASFCRYSARR